jgi:hypothetical protein
VHAARAVEGEEIRFLVCDLDERYHQAVRELGFQLTDAGFARSFPAGSPHLDRIYANFESHIDELILQAAGARPVPWESALDTYLRRVEGQGIDWYLVGSGALAVRGAPVRSGDLDIVVNEEGAQRLGDLLLEYLVEPVVPVHDWFCSWWGRAYLGARVEWVGGVDERADTPLVSDFGPTAAARLQTVTWRGCVIRVPPLNLQREVCQRRGLTERVGQIDRMLGG